MLDYSNTGRSVAIYASYQSNTGVSNRRNCNTITRKKHVLMCTFGTKVVTRDHQLTLLESSIGLKKPINSVRYQNVDKTTMEPTGTTLNGQLDHNCIRRELYTNLKIWNRKSYYNIFSCNGSVMKRAGGTGKTQYFSTSRSPAKRVSG